MLVTGAGGFIGVNLCRRLLAEGAEVHGTVRPGGASWRLPALRAAAVVHAVDLADPSAARRLVETVAPEVVFHAAVRSAYDSQALLGAVVADGLLTLANLLDAITEAPLRRFVLLGSSLGYGSQDIPYREDHPLRPSSRRGVVKAASSLIALQQARDAGIPLVEARLFSVYGPWEPLHRLVPRAIRAALLDEELLLTRPGLRRDLLFVEDAVDGCLAAARAAGIDGQVVNVGSGEEVANEELAEAVAEVTGRSLQTRLGAYPAHETDRPHGAADISYARKTLGWKPRHSLRDGLARTVPWIEERLAEEQ